jgi:hypothetical protein
MSLVTYAVLAHLFHTSTLLKSFRLIKYVNYNVTPKPYSSIKRSVLRSNYCATSKTPIKTRLIAVTAIIAPKTSNRQKKRTKTEHYTC